MSKITNEFNQVWHRMLYSCTHMAAMAIKWLILLWCFRSKLTLVIVIGIVMA